MYRHLVSALFVASLSCGVGCSTTRPPPRAPEVSLDIPPAFGTEVTRRTLQKGEDLLHDPNYHLIPIAPVSEYHGWFGPRAAKQGDIHGWTVRVYAYFSPRVAAAYTSAQDGFDADLNEGSELLAGDSSPYMFARFERKQFYWGNAVSFFNQSTQDTATYVPNNGHLQYEVWGVTSNGRYTIVASIGVSHPKLTEWGPEVRDVDSIEALKNDPDYKLIERCSPEDFVPSLTAFDRLVDSIRIR